MSLNVVSKYSLSAEALDIYTTHTKHRSVSQEAREKNAIIRYSGHCAKKFQNFVFNHRSRGADFNFNPSDVICQTVNQASRKLRKMNLIPKKSVRDLAKLAKHYYNSFIGDPQLRFVSEWRKIESPDFYRCYLQSRGLKIVDLPSSVKDLSCYRYGLRIAGVDPKKLEGPEYLRKNKFQLLLDLDFLPVSHPEPHDCLLFSQKSIPKHLGVITDTGQIYSKPGDGSPYAVIENVEDLPGIYGKEVTCFRKRFHAS